MYFVARRFFSNTNINITKEIRRNFARKHFASNPGIAKRMHLIEDDVIDLEEYDFDLESDFMNVGTTYNDHIKEIQHQKQREQRLIIKQKYFKENSPSFLTWADKEQIRYLHKSDPEEWTIEKLSEGFPALPEVITKVLKVTWTKKSANKIQTHDNSVQENWKLLKENKLTNLNPKLIEHLNKFTNRIFENSNEIKTPALTTTEKRQNNHRMKVGNEFSNIITSYERLKNKNVDDTEKRSIGSNKKIDKPVISDTYLIDGPKSGFRKHITLNALQDNITKKHMQGMVLSDDEILLHQVKEESKDVSVVKKPIEEIIPSEMYKSNTTKLVSTETNKEDNYLLEYPEKITIPKNQLKKGFTYKLNDCYYDDDGLFLYRVPGMYK